jgi:Tol biopolymer transport system component
MAARLVLALIASLTVAVPAGATPPGSNGLIGWQRETPSGFPQVVVANPDGSEARTVFVNPPRRGEAELAFSPIDPNLVFFTRFGMAPFSEDLFRGNLATGAISRLGRPRSADIAPTVSPDGRTIAYFELYTMAVDGTDIQRITSNRRPDIFPDWQRLP